MLGTLFPKSKLGGCWFHLAQSIFTYAQEISLKPAYQTGRKIKTKINLLASLPFVPVRDVRKQFGDILSSLSIDILPLAQYFEATFKKSLIRLIIMNQDYYNCKSRNTGLLTLHYCIKGRVGQYRSGFTSGKFMSLIKGFIYYLPQ